MHLQFDKGTIVIRGLSDATHLEKSFAVSDAMVLWDQRIQSYRAPAYKYSQFLEGCERQKLPVIDDVFSESRVEKWSKVELRDYQNSALQAWTSARRRGVIVIPTGGGKTRIALAAMERANVPALCLVPTRVLLEQWKNEIAKFYAGKVGIIGDGKYELAPITVSTFESAYRQMHRLGNKFKLLIVDEVHHFGCGARDEALEMCIAPYRMGLTATSISESLNENKTDELIGKKVFALTLGDLKGTALSDYLSYTLPIDLNPAERVLYEAEMQIFKYFLAANCTEGDRLAWTALVRLASRSLEGKKAMTALRNARKVLAFPEKKAEALHSILSTHGKKKILIFTSDTNTALEIARRFLVMPITSQIKAKERDWALEQFRVGSLRALVSCRVLNEGMDVPDAEVAIVTGGSFGQREHVQRIGRLLRPSPGKRAIVYELVCRNTSETGQAKRRSVDFDSRLVT